MPPLVSAPPALLLLDPDSGRRQGLAAALAEGGRFLVREADDLSAGWAVLTLPTAAAVSEAQLPQGSGLRLREAPGQAGLPLLLLGDSPFEPAGAGLPAGVRWLARPFRFQVLLEMLAALLAVPPAGPEGGPGGINLGTVWLQPERRQVCDAAGRPLLRLTEKEAAILACLAATPGVAVGREALLAAVWGYRAAVDTHTLATHIYRLRRKLAACRPALEASLITADEGYGWQMPPLHPLSSSS